MTQLPAQMRLYSSLVSAYSRKVRVVAMELELTSRMETIEQRPRDNTAGFHAINPLGRIPVLVLDGGCALYDSPVICDYLNSLVGGALIPHYGNARWNALRRQAIGDGILDIALPLRAELLRADSMRSTEAVERAQAAIDRTLDSLNGEFTTMHPTFDVGAIAIVCALAWLDFRLPDIRWRDRRSALRSWFTELYSRPSFQATIPTD